MCFQLSVGQNDVLGEQWLTFGVQQDRLLATVPEAPDTRKLFIAWELPVSFALRETGKSSTAPEGPTLMVGMHTNQIKSNLSLLQV